MEKIKVLMLVTNLRKSNGVASYVMNYFNTIDKNKIQMDFALLQDVSTPYYKDIVAAGSKYYILPSLSNPIKHYNKCAQIIKKGNYDVVHDNILLASIPLMIAAKKNHVPVRIIHSHNSKLGETRTREKRNLFFLPILLRTSNAYCACSKKAAEAMFGSKGYTFVPNIVTEGKLIFSAERRADIRCKMGVDNKIIVGTVGRVAPQKNPIFALDVICETIKAIPNIEYWWIGSGPLDEAMKIEVKNRGLSDKVQLLGSRDDVPDLYNAIDVFFLPSLFEGLPVTSIEAQAMGLPSVISDSITDELVYTDLVKYVSLNSQIDKWVEAIRNQAERMPYRRSYIKELRESCFSEDMAGAMLLNLYSELISGNSCRK